MSLCKNISLARELLSAGLGPVKRDMGAGPGGLRNDDCCQGLHDRQGRFQRSGFSLGSGCEPRDSRFTSGLRVSRLARHGPEGSGCVAGSQRVEFSQGRVEINRMLTFVCYTLNIKRKGAEQSTRKNLGYLTKASWQGEN